MPKQCLKCGYINNATNLAEHSECPSCQVIYTKYEAFVEKKASECGLSIAEFLKRQREQGEKRQQKTIEETERKKVAEERERRRLMDEKGRLIAIENKKELETRAGTVLGGSGMEMSHGHRYSIDMDQNNLYLISMEMSKRISIPFVQLVTVDVSGPGKVTSNAGVIGGGFGVTGALQGILMAGVINTVTSSTSVNTFLQLTTINAEVFLHLTNIDPWSLRLYLSPAIVGMN